MKRRSSRGNPSIGSLQARAEQCSNGIAISRGGGNAGFACLLPTALVLRVKWPPRRDWPAVGLLGICFFGLFFVLYNIAISFTTAARASLALATLPLHTMVVGALLGVEPLTIRKTLGVC